MLLAGPICKLGCDAPATVSVIGRDVVPLPLVVLVKVTVALYEPAGRALALALTLKVTSFGVVVAAPVWDDTVSQVGTPEMA